MVLMPGFQSTQLATEGALEPFFFLYTDDSIQGNPETCKQSSIMLNYEVKNTMKEIINEDECNDTYGRIRMYQALLLKQPEGVHIPSERTVYRVMDQIGLSHRPRRKPNGLTKADREAMKSDDLLKRDIVAQLSRQKSKIFIMN